MILDDPAPVSVYGAFINDLLHATENIYQTLALHFSCVVLCIHLMSLELETGREINYMTSGSEIKTYSCLTWVRSCICVMMMTRGRPTWWGASPKLCKTKHVLCTVLSALSVPFTMDSMFPILPIHFRPIILFCDLSILCLSSVPLSIPSL